MPAIPSEVPPSVAPPQAVAALQSPALQTAAASQPVVPALGLDNASAPPAAPAMSFGHRLATLLKTADPGTPGDSAADAAARRGMATSVSPAPTLPPSAALATAALGRQDGLAGDPTLQPDPCAPAVPVVPPNQADPSLLQAPEAAAPGNAHGAATSPANRAAAAVTSPLGAVDNAPEAGLAPTSGLAPLPPAVAALPAAQPPSSSLSVAGTPTDQPVTAGSVTAGARLAAATARKPGGDPVAAHVPAGTEAAPPTGAAPSEPFAVPTANNTDTSALANPSLPAPTPLAPPVPVSGAAAPVHSQAQTQTVAPHGDPGGATAPSPAAQVAPALMSLAHGPEGGSRLTLRLDPAELGHVQIRIERPQDAPARVEITAERPETLALLQRDQPQLQRALDQAGVPPDGRSLTFQVGSQQAGGGPGGFGAGGGTSGQSGGGSQNGTAPSQQTFEDQGAAGQPLMPSRWLRAGLDITA